MRTCPKEEETVETCDGMNQKIHFMNVVLKKKRENKKITDFGVLLKPKNLLHNKFTHPHL